MKFLSISPVSPYDDIGHAGGKTYNYYLKNISKKIDVNALLFCPKNEEDKTDLLEYQIDYKNIFTSGTIMTNISHIILDTVGFAIYNNRMFSLFKYCKIVQYLDKLKKQNDFPEIIELEWTNFVYYASKLHDRYPNVKIIASEHDVNFQSLIRKNMGSKRLEKLKEQEINALNCCNKILVQSNKDKVLLTEEGISEEKILVISPYYHNMSDIVRNSNKKDILFWGAMYRPENYKAAIWFIQNVMPLLSNEDVRFVVAGNKPPEELKKLENDKVIVTGFVEDERELFEKSMCFVSPLLTGAGIKVKIIEAFSAGIPILTNSIGIEGIPATNKYNYIHCETAKQYAEAIKKIQNGEIKEQRLLKNQKEFMKNHFDLDTALNEYVEMIKTL